jgi:hypothetical protein
MLQRLQLWLRGFKNYLLYKFFFHIKGYTYYPSSILPKIKYCTKIDIDALLRHQELYILRRSNKTRSETFNELGILREDAILGKEIPGLSMNLLGAKFKAGFIKYVPHVKTRAVVNWDGSKTIYLSDFIGLYSTIEIYSPIFFRGSDIHNISIPYVKKENKELTRILGKLKLKYRLSNGDVKATGRAVLEHVPTNLNYWHVEQCLLNFNDIAIPTLKNGFDKDISGYFIAHVLSVKALPDIDVQPTPLAKSSYER